MTPQVAPKRLTVAEENERDFQQAIAASQAAIQSAQRHLPSEAEQMEWAMEQSRKDAEKREESKQHTVPAWAQELIAKKTPAPATGANPQQPAPAATGPNSMEGVD